MRTVPAARHNRRCVFLPVVTTHDHRSYTLAKKNFLDFEQPIAELESKIEELRYVQTESDGGHFGRN